MTNSGIHSPSMRMLTIRCGAAALILLATSASQAQAPPEKVALTGGRIIPVVGKQIREGVVLIERGKIVAVGDDVKVPYDARVYDVKGKVVFPGLIDAHSSRGMDVANEARPVTPHLDVYDAIDPSQLYYEDALRLGTTAIHIVPGNNTVIGGVSRVVRPIGLSVAEMTIAEGSFLKISARPKRGFDRMLQLATIREAFLELDDYLEKLAEQRYEEDLKKKEKKIDVGPAEARKRGRALIRAEDIDDQHRNLLRLRGGQVPDTDKHGRSILKPLGAMIYCERAMDVGHAVHMARENGFLDRSVFVLGSECYKAIGELKKAARPVVLGPTLIHRETDPLTGEITEIFVPKRIADAGLLFALTPGPNDSLAERMLTYQAARCVRSGIPRAVAIRAITINAAKILGLEDRLGSIEPGKDANLVVYSGDPLDFNSVVERVFIDGIPAYDRTSDVRLKRLLGTESQGDQDDE